ncbi:iron chelate uptake ABC transporter family permease subunit [Microbacterium sp. NE2HP2]|uniref:FecCD family ABC transporter permease n=1 Tax=Microbacterium TaxID=33882 RepID=UPI0023661280|nr:MULTISPECIES: iron chelate uptake ABC transporter family permease subunit [Microbacterium]MDD7943966.1 iron chelate uptake ABC transporter family permease subunit [Microbacterium plantarum]WHE36291.1 iron chelate uptake ABC transporter family permease subunit [Microbacterium sp. BDGP8]WRK17539.1 iron chelate uptake ABC transporter family permease subunit [Microbacterium plantarum]
MSADTLALSRGRDRSSRSLPRRRVWAGAAVALALAGVVFASLAIGTSEIPLDTVWHALTAYDPADPEHIAIIEKRLPRTIVGIVIGAALGLSGTIAQGLTRNPLADPGILGVNQGAALAVVTAITVFGATGPGSYLWFAIGGAAIAAAVVWVLSSRGRDGATPGKLALAGAAVSAALFSLVSAVLIVSREALDAMRFWQVGALAGRGLDVLVPVLPVLIVAAVVALSAGRTLNLFALGDETAAALGLRVNRARLLLAVVLVVLAAAATAVAGPIAFVGLVVPHVVRGIVGADYRWILLFAAPVAAILLVAADVVARIVARPGELQVGIVVAAIGAPFFIALVRRGRMVGL